MNRVVDEKSRMTAADADARFAALVAEHRAGRKTRAHRAAGPADDRAAAVAVALVYCVGVAAGAFFHVRPLVAVLVGGPLVYLVRVLMKRSGDRDDAR